MRPNVGFSPYTPQQLQGSLIDPPPSDPKAKGPIPAATEEAAPQLYTPEFVSIFQGFFVSPKSLLYVRPIDPNSGVFVFPRITQPAFFNRFTVTSSSSGINPASK